MSAAAGALDLDLGGGLGDLAEVVVGEVDVGCSEVFFEPVELPGPGDGNDPRFLCQEPG